jgi:hypothetical protein
MTDPPSLDDLPTCGKGLAAHAALPRVLGELTDAVGEILERHRRALDLADAAAREEDAAYRDIAELHRDAAARLRRIGDRMADGRDLPMGPHDVAVLDDDASRDAFAAFVRLEERLLALLESRLPADRAMLSDMGG